MDLPNKCFLRENMTQSYMRSEFCFFSCFVILNMNVKEISITNLLFKVVVLLWFSVACFFLS